MDLSQELVNAFHSSKAIKTGGPGGFPVKVGNETWNIALTPGGQYCASNGVSNNESPYCSYELDSHGMLWRNRMAVRKGGGWQVNPLGDEPVRSEEEIRWVIDLIGAAETAEWGGEITLRPRPTN
jgi:hypothetical protein